MDDVMSLERNWQDVEQFLAGLDGVRFSMRPDLEAHMKVLADIGHGDIAALCGALMAAWKMQRADAD
jgi:hypothetical protein